MQKLKTLNELLDMVKEAQALAENDGDVEKLRSVVGRIRRAAGRHLADFSDRQKQELTPSRFRLCMTGICEELTFKRTHLFEGTNFKPILGRIRVEIERSIKEIGSAAQPSGSFRLAKLL